MQITTKRLPKSRVEITVEVPAEKMADFISHAIDELGENVEVSGFRKGKAPRAIIEERLGRERIVAAAVDSALPRTYYDAVIQEKLTPIAEPHVHVKQAEYDKPFIYVAEVDVMPEVETGNYRSVKVDKKKYAAKALDQKEVEESIERLRKATAQPKDVLRPAQKGDFIEISYVGKVNGVVQEGLQNTSHPLVLGEGAVIEDFEKQLIGMSNGEEKTFNIDVPTQGGQEKQPAEFSVKINRVAELELPEVNDELAQKFGKKDAAELRQTIEDGIRSEKEQEAQIALEAAVLDEVAKKAKLELPESLINREIEYRLQSFSQELQRVGQTVNGFLAREKKSMEEFRNEMRPSAEQSVKTGLVLRAIAENENLLPENPDKEDAGNEKTMRKVIDFLVETATK